MNIKNIDNEYLLLEYIKYLLKEEKKEISKIKNIAIDEINNKDIRIVIGNNGSIKISDNIDISNFINNLINGRLNLNDSNNNNYKNFNFSYSIKLEHITIKNRLNFYAENDKKEFDGSIEFHDVTFEKEVCIYINTFRNGIYFTKCNFNNKIYLNTTNILNELRIYDSTLKNGINISSCKFDNINIEKCSINGEYKMENSTIYQIYKVININDNNINEKNYDTKMIFNNIIFRDNISLIHLYNIKKMNEININNTFIDGRINLKNIEVEEADFKGSVINGGLINPVNFKVNKFANRESALFLKNEAYARNNAIDALEYKAKEVEKHKEDLIKDWKNNKKLKTLGDILSIELSSIYSDNGQNWIKAFICTVLFPTVFFTLSYNIYNIPIFIFILISFIFIPLCDNTKITKYIFISMFIYLILFIPMQNHIFSILIDIDNKNFIKELLSYITPTNFNQIVSDKINESYIYKDHTIIRAINYFLGKIAFWYGSVQTVTAFRKFAKGA